MSGSFLNAAHIPAFTALNQIRVMRLYRRALKLQMSWTPRYDVFRSQAMEIRRRFDANKDVSDPRFLQKLIDEAEKELYDNRHPDPYIPPTAPGGTKWERNLRAPRVIAPNLKDFQGFQTWAKDQRPYWRILLDLPRKQFEFCLHLFFPLPPPTRKEFRTSNVQAHYDYQNERNTIVEQILVGRDVPEADKPAQRRYERLIYNVKKEINEWDWDAQFADIEDSGDRKALFEACFAMVTNNQRLRRLRFHREAMERVKRLEKALPPVERREFLAKEVAIAACHGHIGDRHYAEVTEHAPDPESIAARDKLYQKLVVDFFIPHLEKFRGVIEKRDDFSPLEQTRWYWRPKAELIAKIDNLLAISRLQQTITDDKNTEWIYELWMAPKFYTEMEREPGAALEYTYWVQGKDYVPEGYISPDEQMWAMEDQFEKEAEEAVEATKKALRDDFEKRGFVGASP